MMLQFQIVQYTAGVKMSTLEPITKAMAALGDAVAKDAQLESILATPTLSPDDKSAIVNELQKLAGPAGTQAAVSNFLATLAENNRLGILKGVCEKFGVLMSAAQGEIELVVTSAQVRRERYRNDPRPVEGGSFKGKMEGLRDILFQQEVDN